MKNLIKSIKLFFQIRKYIKQLDVSLKEVSFAKSTNSIIAYLNMLVIAIIEFTDDKIIITIREEKSETNHNVVKVEIEWKDDLANIIDIINKYLNNEKIIEDDFVEQIIEEVIGGDKKEEEPEKIEE
jgi:hypothetical protein